MALVGGLIVLSHRTKQFQFHSIQLRKKGTGDVEDDETATHSIQLDDKLCHIFFYIKKAERCYECDDMLQKKHTRYILEIE